MAPLAPLELLSVWEHAYGRSPLERALVFLAGLFPGQALDDLLVWPIGYRDRQIARLRQRQFGRVVRSVSECPRCAESVEFEMDLQHCFSPQAPMPAPAEVQFEDGRLLTVRPLHTADLMQVRPEDGEATRTLLERCVRTNPLEPGELLTDIERSAVSRKLEEIDPEARIEIALTCPACGAAWSGTFDIAAIFWAELNAWARRTLQEVHAIASRYGWSEREILGMSPWRRRVYLGLVGAGTGAGTL